jgi:hypothetical protein
MKKYIITVIILLGFQFAKSQVYNIRHNYAYNDTVRVRFKMAAIEVAVERFDTANVANGSKRQADKIVAYPNDSRWLDRYVFPYAATANKVPTDAEAKAYVILIWNRIAYLGTKDNW